jgi:hypothetical protein
MRTVMVIAVVVAGAAGCATMRAAATRSTEQMLSAAGFHMAPADTPETQAQAELLPPRQITPWAGRGQTSYVYSDPDVCRCLYVGTESQYQEYQRLRVERDIEDQRALNSWGYWTSWPSWWW